MVCWEGGEHSTLLIMSIVAILAFPVTYLSLTGYASFNFGPLSVRRALRERL